MKRLLTVLVSLIAISLSCSGQDRYMRRAFFSEYGGFDTVATPTADLAGRRNLIYGKGDLGLYYIKPDGTIVGPLGAGGSGSPAGSNTQIQFNDNSLFGGDVDFTWDKTNNIQDIVGKIRLTGVSAPSAPASGKAYIYLNSSDSKVYSMHSDGTPHDLESGGSGSPGGGTYDVQYNTGSAFGGEDGFEYFATSDSLLVPNITWNRFCTKSTGWLLNNAGTGWVQWFDRYTGGTDALARLWLINQTKWRGTANSNEITIQSPSTVKHSYSMTWPDTLPGAAFTKYVPIANSSGTLSWELANPVGVNTWSTSWDTKDSAVTQDQIDELHRRDRVLCSWVIPSGSQNTTDKFIVMQFERNFKITKVRAVGTTTVNVTFQIYYGSDISATGTAVFGSAQALTNSTTGSSWTSFSNTTPAAGDHLWLKFTDTTTKPTQVMIELIGAER